MPDIAYLKTLITDVGVPLAICAVFLFIVIYAFFFGMNFLAEHVKKQTTSLAAVAVNTEAVTRSNEKIADSLVTMTAVLDTLCATTTRIEAQKETDHV